LDIHPLQDEAGVVDVEVVERKRRSATTSEQA
jgi:hypothetical protein